MVQKRFSQLVSGQANGLADSGRCDRAWAWRCDSRKYDLLHVSHTKGRCDKDQLVVGELMMNSVLTNFAGVRALMLL